MQEEKMFTKSPWGYIHLYTTMETTNNIKSMKSIFDK